MVNALVSAVSYDEVFSGSSPFISARRQTSHKKEPPEPFLDPTHRDKTVTLSTLGCCVTVAILGWQAREFVNLTFKLIDRVSPFGIVDLSPGLSSKRLKLNCTTSPVF
jgi:hypothetical protein